jgi:hypothetical protein
MFHVWQHVVCVDADGAPALHVGVVYTVKAWWETDPARCTDMRGRSCVGGLLLFEVFPAPGTRGFADHRFRPLSSTRLDVFRQLLVSPKERVGA